MRKQSEAKCEICCELLVRSFEVLSSSESCKGQQHGRRINSQRVVGHATD